MGPDIVNSRVEGLLSALITMDRLAVRDLIRPSGESASRERIIDEIIVPALEEIGKRWEEGSLAISQVYMAGILVEEAITSLFPESAGQGREKSAIATVVLEDYHMLGERIVAANLIGAGYAPIRYGHREAGELVSLVRKDSIRYLLISALMLPSALKVREVTTQLAGSGVKIIVGGAPFRIDPGLGKEVGADRVCFTASDALAALRELEAQS